MACRTCFVALLALLAAVPAMAQSYVREKPRRHFVTVSYDTIRTQPLHFAEHPLSELVGADVAIAQRVAHDYETRDGATRIDVLEFSRRQIGGGITVYPFGASVGATLMLRASLETMPRIRVDFDGESPLREYRFTDARAFDAAAGVMVADRSPGWGLGSHAFVAAGLGRITSGLGPGSRVFAEGGGGVGVGPFGVDLAVKFAWNTLDAPVRHRFLTVPISVRGTLTF